MKMSKYSDDFFREYEEIYSDSEKQNTYRSADRGISGGNEPNRNRRPRGSAQRNSISSARRTQREREFYDFESGDNYDRNDRQGETYRTVSRRPSNASGSPRPRSPRPSSDQPHYKLPRTARRAIIIGVLIVFVVGLLSGLIAIVSSASGGVNVEELKTTQVAARQVALSWDKAKKAEGYRVLMSQGESEDYQEYQLIDDPDTCEITVSDLEQAARYNFSVTAVRSGKDIGKPTKLPAIWTKPDAPEITNIMSTKKGEIHVDWSENDKAEGYILEYKKDGGEYTADTTLTFSAGDDRKTDITGLEVNATYTVRMSSYYTPQDQLRGDPFYFDVQALTLLFIGLLTRIRHLDLRLCHRPAALLGFLCFCLFFRFVRIDAFRDHLSAAASVNDLTDADRKLVKKDHRNGHHALAHDIGRRDRRTQNEEDNDDIAPCGNHRFRL